MTYAIQIVLGLLLVVFRTTFPGHAIPLFSAYDLMVPFVLGVGLFRPMKEGIIIVIFCGLAMDVYSGAPPWYYFVTYFWLFVVSRWLPSFLHADNIFFLAAFCGGGALFQEIFMHLCVFFLKSQTFAFLEILKQSGLAAFCGAITGPLLIMVQNSILDWEIKRQDRRERFV
ncbi:MAG: hypothetical protein JEZ02_19345 [Desulfatibacillum sp.]|nr:hypothetical protein [Desulfatibacillum sp.]